MTAPPEARNMNWLVVVEVVVAEPSPQTNEWSLTAWALSPAAKQDRPLAMLLAPPGTAQLLLLAWLFKPPAMADHWPLALLLLPPPMNEYGPLAVLPLPPATV